MSFRDIIDKKIAEVHANIAQANSQMLMPSLHSKRITDFLKTQVAMIKSDGPPTSTIEQLMVIINSTPSKVAQGFSEEAIKTSILKQQLAVWVHVQKEWDVYEQELRDNNTPELQHADITSHLSDLYTAIGDKKAKPQESDS